MASYTTPERLQLALIGAIASCDALMFWRGPMTIAASDPLTPFAAGLAAVLLGLYYRLNRGEERLAKALIGTAHLIWFSCALALLNYHGLAADRPLIDAVLHDWDRSLGIDWPWLFATLKSQPFVSKLLSFAYSSSLLQIAVLVPVLSLLGGFQRLDRFFLALILAAITTVSFWTLFPSFGAGPYLYATGQMTDFPGAVLGIDYAKSMMALKAGHSTHVVLANVEGLIAFPSFHSVMLVLTVYGAAGIPRAIWPVAAWNLVVLIAVPVDGSHHVVDVAAGVVVAIAAIVAADAICTYLARSAQAVPQLAPKAHGPVLSPF